MNGFSWPAGKKTHNIRANTVKFKARKRNMKENFYIIF